MCHYLGHSGSGKTTLLCLIGDLTNPDGGTVCIENIDNRQQTDGELAVSRNKDLALSQVKPHSSLSETAAI